MSLPYGNFQSQKELDVAYDVDNSVADFMLYAHQYITGSEQTRNHLKCHLNVSYGPTVDEYVDVFPAANAHAHASERRYGVSPWQSRVMSPWQSRVMSPWQSRVMSPWQSRVISHV